MKKKIEVNIEKYSDVYFENVQDSESRAYEKNKNIENNKGKPYFGYQITINSSNPQIFARNYIEKINGHYIFKEGGNFKESKNIDIAHTLEEAYKKAYEHISKKPKEKIEKMMDDCGLEKIIHDKESYY